MAKVILICGKICSGKTTYAAKLRDEMHAVLLSVDEIMLALFGRDAGTDHDRLAKLTQTYLFEKSLEILASGIDVILDWGFWTKDARMVAKAFYQSRDISCEIHGIVIDDTLWRERIAGRNADVMVGKTNAYYVDEGLAKKFDACYEAPNTDEIDVIIRAECR